MKSILQMLYNGQVYPAEDMHPTDPKYFESNDKIHAEMEVLKQHLSPEDLKRLETMGGYQSDMCDIDVLMGFKHGFKLGVMIMCELFLEDDKAKSNK